MYVDIDQCLRCSFLEEAGISFCDKQFVVNNCKMVVFKILLLLGLNYYYTSNVSFEL